LDVNYNNKESVFNAVTVEKYGNRDILMSYFSHYNRNWKLSSVNYHTLGKNPITPEQLENESNITEYGGTEVTKGNQIHYHKYLFQDVLNKDENLFKFTYTKNEADGKNYIILSDERNGRKIYQIDDFSRYYGIDKIKVNNKPVYMVFYETSKTHHWSREDFIRLGGDPNNYQQRRYITDGLTIKLYNSDLTELKTITMEPDNFVDIKGGGNRDYYVLFTKKSINKYNLSNELVFSKSIDNIEIESGELLNNHIIVGGTSKKEMHVNMNNPKLVIFDMYGNLVLNKVGTWRGTYIKGIYGWYGGLIFNIDDYLIFTSFQAGKLLKSEFLNGDLTKFTTNVKENAFADLYKHKRKYDGNNPMGMYERSGETGFNRENTKRRFEGKWYYYKPPMRYLIQNDLYTYEGKYNRW